MTIIPSIFCPVFLPPPVRVFPVSAWIVLAPPGVAAVSAATVPLGVGVAVGIPVAGPPGVGTVIAVA